MVLLAYLALVKVLLIVRLVVEVVVKYVEPIKSGKYFLCREVGVPSGLLEEPRPSRTVRCGLALGMKREGSPRLAVMAAINAVLDLVMRNILCGCQT